MTAASAGPGQRPFHGDLPTEPVVAIIQGERWLICPLRGSECCRIPDTSSWSADAMAVHIQVSHRGTRSL